MSRFLRAFSLVWLVGASVGASPVQPPLDLYVRFDVEAAITTNVTPSVWPLSNPSVHCHDAKRCLALRVEYYRHGSKVSILTVDSHGRIVVNPNLTPAQKDIAINIMAGELADLGGKLVP